MMNIFEAGKIRGREWMVHFLKTQSAREGHERITQEATARTSRPRGLSRFDEGFIEGAELALQDRARLRW
jgi:hypothetical protein